MVRTRAFDEIVDFITSIPQPQQVLTFKPSDFAQKRLENLLEKKRNEQLNEEEVHEIEQFLMMEHLMRIAKSKARKSINQ
jgi:hypothetical protein